MFYIAEPQETRGSSVYFSRNCEIADYQVFLLHLGNFTKPKPPICLEALGMQNGKIEDSAVSASTEYGTAYKAINGRLHFVYRSGRIGAWAAKTSDAYQFLQVNFGDWTKVTRVAIQGRSDSNQWVKNFTLSYGYDHIFFKDYKADGIKKVSGRQVNCFRNESK